MPAECGNMESRRREHRLRFEDEASPYAVRLSWANVVGKSSLLRIQCRSFVPIDLRQLQNIIVFTQSLLCNNRSLKLPRFTFPKTALVQLGHIDFVLPFVLSLNSQILQLAYPEYACVAMFENKAI